MGVISLVVELLLTLEGRSAEHMTNAPASEPVA